MRIETREEHTIRSNSGEGESGQLLNRDSSTAIRVSMSPEGLELLLVGGLALCHLIEKKFKVAK